MTRHFSLLEVLIALVLITVSLPLLIAPFVYATVDQMETVKKMDLEKKAFYLLTQLLADLPLNQLESNQEYPFKEDANVTYSFKKLKNGDRFELWQVTLTFKEGSPFNFNFIVKRNAPTEENIHPA